MTGIRQFVSLWLLVCVAACGTRVPANNAYDPEAPESVQEKARFEGQVLLEATQASGGALVVFSEAVSKGTALTYDTTSEDPSGDYAIEVPAGIYNAAISRTGYVSVFYNNLDVKPGDIRALGTARLIVARGSVSGVVTIDDGTSPSGTSVSIISVSGPGTADALTLDEGTTNAGNTEAVLVASDGTYSADGLAAGDYLVRAEKDAYAPSYADQAVTVQLNADTAAPDLRLYPASAIVQVEVNGVVNAPYTNSRDVKVLLLAFVEFLTDMRVSEDPLFTDMAFDIDYREFNAQVDFTLGDEDGTHDLFAQFKDSLEQESNIFSTSVVLDRQAPEVLSLTINDGAKYLTTQDGSGAASVRFTGQDTLSGVDAYRYTLAPAFTNEPWIELESVDTSVALSLQASLGDANGQKVVLLQLRDRAGNESTMESASIIRDKAAPSVSAPAITIAEADDSDNVPGLQVTLSFGVTGDRANEALYMAVANAEGLDADSFFIPVVSPYTHMLTPGPDGARKICAIFKDSAGLLTEQHCASVTLDRTGGVKGVVYLEGVDISMGDHSGTDITLVHATAPADLYTTATGVDGTFVIGNIPAGTGYVMRIDHGGFVSQFQYDVSVIIGVDTDRGALTLAIPRASLFGRLTLVGAGDGQHAGIVISDANSTLVTVTDPDGYFTMSSLPISASYQLSARYPGYLPFLGFNQIDDLTAGENRNLGDIALVKQQGDFNVCDKDDGAASPCTAIAFTAETIVRLDLNNTTNSCYRVALNQAFTPDADYLDADKYTAYDNSLETTFEFKSQPDGQKSIYVQFADPVSGTDCATVEDPGTPKAGVVTLDTTAPVPAAADPVVINADSDGIGAKFSKHPAGLVTLSLSATDQYSGVTTMHVLNELPAVTPDFAGVPSQAYAKTVQENLDIGTQGEQWLYVKFCDLAGNCTVDASAPGDSILYDSEPPSTGTGVDITVNNDDPVTDSPFVTVSIDTGDAVAVRFGNTETLVGNDFIGVQSYQSLDFQHFLQLGDGAKTVYAQFRDEAGNLSAVSPSNAYFDTTALDTLPPTGVSFSVVEGLYTNQDDITLRIGATGASQYLLHIGDVEDFSSSTPVAYSETEPGYMQFVEALPTLKQGAYNVYVKLFDAAGNETATFMRTITRDTVAPQFPSVEILEGAYSDSQTVNLVLYAVGATQMIIAPDGTIDSEDDVPYAPAATLGLLPAGPGLKTVRVRFSDDAGNPSADVTAQTTVDTQMPTLTSFSVMEGDYVADTDVVLTIDATGASSMMLSNNSSFTGAAWEPYAATRAWTLTPIDNAKEIWIKLMDEADNTTGATKADTTLDTTAPAGSVSIESDDPYATSGTVDVDISATDLNSAAGLEYWIANDPLFSSGSFQAFASPITHANWVLPAGDGAKTVYVRFRDAAGNVSDKADAVIVDTGAPVGTVTLASGAVAVTSAGSVPVLLTADHDVIRMKRKEGLAQSCTALEVDQDYVANTAFTFSAAVDGPMGLTVCFKDGAGLVSKAEDSVLLDTALPSASLLINGGTGLYTSSSVVTLTISASDGAGSGVDAIRIANQQGMTGVSWEALGSASRSWTLGTPGTDELKTVWLEVRDKAGLVRDQVSATIWLDTAVPSGSISVDEGAYAADAGINLTLTRDVATTAQMSVAQGFLDCSGASYEAFSGSKALTLNGDDGVKALSFCLKDNAGNTAGFSTDVMLDRQSPVGSLVINSGASHTAALGVNLQINTDTDVVQMFLANGTIDCTDDGSYITFNAAPSHNVTPTDGLRTIKACVRDSAKNYKELTATITLDRVAPYATTVTTLSGIEIDADAAQTDDVLVGLSLAAADATSSVTSMKLSNDNCSGGVWQDHTTSSSWTLAAGDGEERTVCVEFRDQAGLVSTPCACDSITVDTVQPAITIFAIDGGEADPEYTSDAAISIMSLIYVDNNTCNTIQVSEDATFATGLTPYPCNQTWGASTTYTLTNYAGDGTQDGLKYVYARILDAAGNASEAAVDTVILDTGGPTEGGVVIDDGAAYTADLLLTVQFIASGATEMKISTDDVCSGGVWEPYKPLDNVTHPGGGATLWVSAEFRDDAGNGEGICYKSSIAYDSSWAGTDSIAIAAIEGQGGFTTSLEVQLTLSPGETTGVQMKISNGNACSGGSWEPFVDGGGGSMTKTWTLGSGGEGARSVSVLFKDSAGNESGCESAAINIDTVAPSALSVTINSNDEYTTAADRVVNLSLAANGMSTVYVSETASDLSGIDCTAGGWQSPAGLTFTLSLGSGLKTVFAGFCDVAGNLAAAASDGIILDNQSPTGTVKIDADATYTNDGAGVVSLSLSASDDYSGVSDVSYRTSSNDSTWTGWTKVSFEPTLVGIALRDAGIPVDNESRWVEVKYHDVADNESAADKDLVQLDNVAPTLGATPIAINGGVAATASQLVTLSLSATASTALEMQLANGQGCTGAGAWQAFTSTVTGWLLDGTGDDVQKYVSVRFRDAAGNETDCGVTEQDSINIDTVAPVVQWVSIEDNAQYTNSNGPGLTISYSGNPTWMYIANSETGLEGATAIPAAGTATYNATADPEGTLAIYVRLEDDAGNQSNALRDTIIRDRTPPTAASVTIDSGVIWATAADGQVDLSLSAADTYSSVAQMKVRVLGAPSWPVAEPYAQTKPSFDLGTIYPGGGGDEDIARGVEVVFIDAAGNQSSSVSDTVRFDNVPPGATAKSISIASLGGNTVRTNSATVRLTLFSSGNPSTMRISNSDNCSGGVTYAYATAIIWTLGETGDGVTADASVMFYDAAGNPSSPCITDDITVDTVAPALGSITLDGRYTNTGVTQGTDPLDTKDCYIAITGATVSGTYSSIQFSTVSSFSTVMQSVSYASMQSLPYYALRLPSATGPCDTEGYKYLYARAIDATSNVSGTMVDTIRVDRTAPTGASLRLNSGVSHTNDLAMAAYVPYAYDAGGIETLKFYHTSSVCTLGGDETYIGYGRSYAYTYAGSSVNGIKTVWMCVVDGAGNQTGVPWDQIYYDTTAPTSTTIRIAGPSGTLFSAGANATDRCNTAGSPADPHYVGSQIVTAVVTGTDGSGAGLSKMKIAEDVDLGGFVDADFDAVSWNNWYGYTNFQLSSGDGPKMVSMKAMDALDNESTAGAATPVCVTLDTTPPESVSISIDQGEYTSSTTVDATLTATDFTTNSSGMQMCFSSSSSLASSGIRNSSGGIIGSEGNSSCSSSSNWYAYNSDLKLVFSSGSGNRYVFLYVRDAVGNKQLSAGMDMIYLDATNPETAPTLNIVQGGNKSAHLFWTAGADGQSGVAGYEISYNQTQPTSGGTTTLVVDGDLTEYIVTGLSNRNRYQFRLRAIDESGRYSGYSLYEDTAVGYTVHPVTYETTQTIIPFGTQIHEGRIYVGYAKVQTYWGMPTSTLHLAVSADAGESWNTFSIDDVSSDSVDGDIERTPSRETAGLYVGRGGVLVVSVSGSQTDRSDHMVTAWRSLDQGLTWTSKTVDSQPPHGESGFSLTRQGGVLAVVYERESGGNTYIARSNNSGVSWSVALSYSNATLANSVGICNTQFKLEWFWKSGTNAYLMYSNDLGLSSSLDATPGTMTGIRHMAIDCNDPIDIYPNDGKAYVAYTKTSGSSLFLRENDSNGSAYWDSAELTLKSSGVDILNRPAVYAAGIAASEKLFVAYKDTNGDVWIGESTNPDSVGTYSWVEADKTGNRGVNLVMNGTGMGSPVLAYTDETGHQLFVLRAVLPAPVMIAGAAEAEAGFSWVPMPDVDYHLITSGSPDLLTPETIHSFSSGADSFSVGAVDDYEQTGEPGMTWELSPFTYDYLDSGGLYSNVNSKTGAMHVDGSTIYSLIPLNVDTTAGTCNSVYDICLFVSTNSGVSYAGYEARTMTKDAVASHMAVGDNGAGVDRIHIVHTDSDTYPDLEYRRADASALSTWSAVTLDSYDPDSAQPPNDTTRTSGYQAQVSVSGAYVVVTWVQDYTSIGTRYRHIRYRYSTNRGVSWSGTKYVLNDNTLSYTPQNLTVIYHSNAAMMFAWTNSSKRPYYAYSSSVTAATPSWSSNPMSTNTYVDANILRGGRYQDTWVVGFIGRTSLFDMVDIPRVLLAGEYATSASNQWMYLTLDEENAVPDSMAVHVDSQGIYIAYATERTILGATTRQLKLTYCKQECTGPENWHTNVVRMESDASSYLDEDFEGILLGVDPSSRDIYISATRERNGTDYYMVQRGGRMRRTQ